MGEYEKELMKALESVNLEYITLSNSREYLLGNRIMQLKDCIMHLRINELKMMIRRKRAQKKLNKAYPAIKPKQNKTRAEWLQDLTCEEQGAKVVVYTCILGGYDHIADPVFQSRGFDYCVFTDEDIDSKVWKAREVPEYLKKLRDKTTINRYIKLHPAELFPEYDYAIYIDGNVTVVSDLSALIRKTKCTTGIAMHRHVLRDCIYEEGEACILYGKGDPYKLKKQLDLYRNEGFPRHYGMLEGTVIISDLVNDVSADILDAWWEEFLDSGSQRDQIALPYVLWKKGISISGVGDLGSNVYLNPKFRVKSH